MELCKPYEVLIEPLKQNVVLKRTYDHANSKQIEDVEGEQNEELKKVALQKVESMTIFCKDKSTKNCPLHCETAVVNTQNIIMKSNTKSAGTICKEILNKIVESIAENEVVNGRLSNLQSYNVAPMTTSISSMFATSCKEFQSNARKLEEEDGNENTLFRVAESLLMLGDVAKTPKYCIACKQVVNGTCRIHGNPMQKLKQTKAVLSTPSTLCVQKSSIENAGLGVFSMAVHDVGSLFGPMDGKVLFCREYVERQGNNSYIWQIYNSNRKSILHYLDCNDEEKSSWMRFVNCARFEEEQNLIAEQYDEKIFYKAYKKILPGQELLVWYGDAFGQSLQETNLNLREEKYLSQDFIPKVNFNEKKISHTKDILKCKHCSALFSTDHHRSQHIRYVCPESANFRCTDCPKQFRSLRTLKNHKKRGHDATKRFQCIICSTSFSEQGNLKVHLKLHLDIKAFPCKQCDLKFSRNTFLRNHVSAVHDKEQPFICDVCGRPFSRADSLKRHRQLHDDIKNEMCAFCGATYATANNLACHVKKKHSEDKVMIEGSCTICSLSFRDLATHNAFVHDVARYEQCPLCHKSFRRLLNHMKAHKKRTDVSKKTYMEVNDDITVHCQNIIPVDGSNDGTLMKNR